MAALPMSDDYPARRAPFVTYLLIAANVVVYLITPVAALLDRYGTGTARECAQVIFLYEWAAIPRELLSGHQIPFAEVHGSLIPGPCLAQLQPFHKVVWLSPLWAMFLHGGTMHILGNMLYLYVFGTPSGRNGSLYLARVPEAQILTQSAYQYWNGSTWVTNNESAATAVVSALPK